MKSFTKRLLTALTASAAVFTLSACGSTNNTEFGLQLENGDEALITTDLQDISKQEVFEAMVMSPDNFGGSIGLAVLLDKVDYDVLQDIVEIAPEVIEAQLQEFRDMNEDFESFILANGFKNEDELFQHLEMGAMREALRDKVEVSEEEIEAVYNTYYEENNSDDFPTLDEVRGDIENMLLQEALTEKLARLRYEAGFVILDAYLHNAYVSQLEAEGITTDGLVRSVNETSTTVAARLGDIEYTAEQLNETLLTFVGLSAAIALIDTVILEDTFEVTTEDVTDVINDFKIQLGDQFFPMMEQFYGLSTEEEIFEYFRLMLLQDEVFTSRYNPSEERLKELYEAFSIDGLSARHILVETLEEAEDIIAQLNEAEDVVELFIELAAEYGLDGTADFGGDLGTFDLGVMVEDFENAVLALDYSEFTKEPVKTSFGYHVIYRYEVEKGTFDEMRDQLLQDELSRLYSQTRVDAILLDLREGVNMVFTNEFLQTRYNIISENIHEALALEDALLAGETLE